MGESGFPETFLSSRENLLWAKLLRSVEFSSIYYDKHPPIFNFWQFDYNVPRWRSLQIYTIWCSLGFLDLDFYFLPQAWKVFCHCFFESIFSTFSLSSPSGMTIMHTLSHLMVSHKPLKPSSLFFFLSLFLLLWLDDFQWPIFKSFLDLYFAWSSLLFKHSTRVFSSVIVLFSSMILVFLYYLCWNIQFVHALFSWPQWTSF